ncbi:glycosyltransferase [Lactococcus termiticola]|uniref:Glycosyl transferase family 28 C-terminal domain-containing protein n=1 Tax=Lactococcus termiticola TaxID=2169526 RepID=A0A2R5HIM7_9LACT|nr:glycosyltransferase [Lactococcus termiticola]GBG95901.1 hypothetical protein NtB2_00003 [Lactococcus termiticola]
MKNNIALVPTGTGTGHSMRMFAVAQAIYAKNPNINIYVYLESVQDTFQQLFEGIGATVINLKPNKVDDYSKHSALGGKLTWESTIPNFLGKSFFNSNKVLLLLKEFENNKINLVVSDLDASGIFAAKIRKIPSVFVTERFNMPFASMTEDQFVEAGFEFESKELESIKYINNIIYNWAITEADEILTDCPYVEGIDNSPVFSNFLSTGKAKFIGPMIRPTNEIMDMTSFLEKEGIKKSDFLIVAAIGGTSMFVENKYAMQDAYVELFKELHKCNSAIKMVLLAREKFEVPEGMVCLDYLPDWYGLLTRSNLMLSHPGWISVTELCALKVPAIFVLSSKKEYHEWEELEKLKALGFKTNIGLNIAELKKEIAPFIDNENYKKEALKVYSKIAPWVNGAERAAENIIEKLRGADDDI